MVVETEGSGNSDNAIVLIAPFYKTRSRLTRFFRLSTLRFIGRGGDLAPDDLNILLTDDETLVDSSLKALFDAISDSVKVQRILLEEVPMNSALSTRCHVHSKCIVEATQTRHVAALTDQWETFVAGLSRNTRKRIKNRRNRLKANSALTLNLCKDRESVLEAFDALIDLHKARQHGKGSETAFSNEQYLAFHRELLNSLVDQDAVQFVTLLDDHKIVGVEYLFVHNGNLMFYQTGFDQEYESVSPGHNMMVYAIEAAFDQGFTRLDLLKGDYEYKNSYADATEQSIQVSIYRSWLWQTTARLLAKRQNTRSSG